MLPRCGKGSQHRVSWRRCDRIRTLPLTSYSELCSLFDVLAIYSGYSLAYSGLHSIVQKSGLTNGNLRSVAVFRCCESFDALSVSCRCAILRRHMFSLRIVICLPSPGSVFPGLHPLHLMQDHGIVCPLQE